jgi:hypothetical protein
MRIGNVSPRINGLRLGIGAFSSPDLSGQISSYLNSFMVGLASSMEHGTAATPDVVAETLTQAAKDSCAAVAPIPCDPSSVASQIASAVATYTAAYNSAKANLQANVAAGLIATPLPASAYITPDTPPASSSQVQYSSQPSNALDRVTPQTSSVRGPGPMANVLAPPTTQAPVSSTNAGSFTGTSTVAVAPGSTGGGMTEIFRGSVSIGGFEIPNIALIGAAALGLFLMVKGKGK